MSTSSSTAPPTRGRALAPDLARGAMLLMIALAHAHTYLSGHRTGFRGYPVDGHLLDRVVTAVQVVLVDGRAMPMFAALFGYGFVQLAARRGGDPRPWLRRRGWWLLVFGAAHALLLFFGDILGAYGLAALVLAGAVRWRDRTLLAVAGAWLVVPGAAMAFNGVRIVEFGGPADLAAAADPVGAVVDRVVLWSALTPLLLVEVVTPVLLGVWAARRRVLEEPGRHGRFLRWTAAVGIGAAVLGGLPLGLADAGVWSGGAGVYLLHGLTGLGGGLGYAALVGLVAMRAEGPVVTALAACGRRSLSCYLAQSVVFVAVFVPYAGGLGDDLGTAAASGVAVVTWAGTVAFAEALRRAGRGGPAESLLRRLTGRPS